MYWMRCLAILYSAFSNRRKIHGIHRQTMRLLVTIFNQNLLPALSLFACNVSGSFTGKNTPAPHLFTATTTKTMLAFLAPRFTFINELLICGSKGPRTLKLSTWKYLTPSPAAFQMLKEVDFPIASLELEKEELESLRETLMAKIRNLVTIRKQDRWPWKAAVGNCCRFL